MENFGLTTTSEEAAVLLELYQVAKMKRKEAEKEEDGYMRQLAACITRLPQTNSPNLPLSASYLSAVFHQANLKVPIIQKRKKDKDSDDEDEEIVPQKKKKIEKEEEDTNYNKPKRKKEKHSIFFALHTQEEKKKWGVLGKMDGMTSKRQANWTKGLCDTNNIATSFYNKEEGYDREQFEEDNNKRNSIFNKPSSTSSSSPSFLVLLVVPFQVLLQVLLLIVL
jgi:hypothetical protein